MNMLRQAIALWKSEKRKKGTTLQRRLILFFASVTAFLILVFALLLMLFGINGRGEKAVQSYMTNEQSHVSEAVSQDFGRLSLLGINLSSLVSNSCDGFFAEQGITAKELQAHPELLEPLLDKQMQYLLSMMNNNTCSGAFILLDATVNPEGEHADTSRAGLFIKTTQPLSVQNVGAKTYCLRGSAQIARRNNVELLGQWRMEYDISGEDYWNKVMETARENEALPLSRLYYWTGRVTLHGNSESCFLLCVPLISVDNTVFGVCGIEVSDRMFKQLYSPKDSDYENVFAIAALSEPSLLRASSGMIAGNYYLTGYRMTEDLNDTGQKNGFDRFEGSQDAYGGLTEAIRLYPKGSPYANEQWSVAVLMPEILLEAAIQGNSAYLFLIMIVLLICSLTASVVISHRYLHPVTRALDSIRNQSYEGSDATPYLEINDLFVFLADKDSEHEEELRRLEEQRRGAESKYDQAYTALTRIADQKKKEIDQDSYELFLTNLETLTRKEREVFNLYLDGKTAKEIVAILAFSENALKYHNKNIYGKLGVSSRKELLMYAALMKVQTEECT